MALREEMEQQGNWLFRHRSYVPLVLLVPVFIVMVDYEYPLGSYRLHLLMHLVSMLICVAGLGVRCLVAGYVPDGTSGRNTKEQIAESLNTTGLYSVVRHPLYLGNFLLWGGIPVFCFNGWLMLVFCLAFWVYYERIMYAEEAFLRSKFGTVFDDWAAGTPAFVPRFSQWVVSSRKFSWRRAFRQEYTTLFLLIEAQVGLQLMESAALGRHPMLDTEWALFAAAGVGIYFFLRFLKKHTTVLTTASA